MNRSTVTATTINDIRPMGSMNQRDCHIRLNRFSAASSRLPLPRSIGGEAVGGGSTVALGPPSGGGASCAVAASGQTSNSNKAESIFGRILRSRQRSRRAGGSRG